MAHLHTRPGGHDVTVSALVLREVEGRWRVLVHRHRRTGATLQPGGHVEHDENVWQALAHELAEETGYGLGQLTLLQAVLPDLRHGQEPVGENLPLPVPFAVKVHEMLPGHFHNDLMYALVADADPEGAVGEGESAELWWADPEELDADERAPEMLAAVTRSVIEHAVPGWHRVPATAFSLEDPPALP